MSPSIQESSAVVTIGALHLDEIATPLAPLERDASNPVRWQQHVGGVATNAARACARTLPTTLIAAVGRDTTGQRLASGLNDQGINTRLVFLEGHSTGRYTAVLNADGKLFVGLADVAQAESLTMEHIHQQLPSTPPVAVMVDANLRADVLQAIAQYMNQLTSTGHTPRLIGLNVSPFKVDRWRPIASSVDLLFCNRAEAARFARLEVNDGLPHFADALQAAGFRQFVITDGSDKLLVQEQNNRHLIDVPQIPLAGSVNGAGDALAGAAGAAWSQSHTLLTSVVNHGLPAATDVLCGNRAAPRL